MNNVTLSGRVCNVPKIRVLKINGKNISICNFTIAIMEGLPENGMYSSSNTDFIECVCFNSEALAINANFIKGSKITCIGKIKNHFFEDSNRTKHFTNILVLSQVEFGDTASAFDKNVDKKKAVDLSISSNITDVLALYESVCDNGYLCIDEDEYYRIAMENFCS